MPHMPAAKAAAEPAMLKGMVDVVTHVISAGVVTNPGLPIHVRGVGVALLVAEVTILFDRVRCSPHGRRPMRRNSLMPSATPFAMLGKRGNCKNEQSSKSQLNGFHRFLQMPSGKTAIPGCAFPWRVITN